MARRVVAVDVAQAQGRRRRALEPLFGYMAAHGHTPTAVMRLAYEAAGVIYPCQDWQVY